MTTLIARLPREGGPTPYTTLGDWAAWTSAALLLLALTGLRRAVRPEKG
jgi:apolipoprotein N-acyltransferase